MSEEQTKSATRRYKQAVVELERVVAREHWLFNGLMAGRVEHELRMHPDTYADLLRDPNQYVELPRPFGYNEDPHGSPIVQDPSMEYGQIDLRIVVCPPHERKP